MIDGTLREKFEELLDIATDEEVQWIFEEMEKRIGTNYDDLDGSE